MTEEDAVCVDGHALKAGQKFCTECGQPVATQLAALPAPPSSEQNHDSSPVGGSRSDAWPDSTGATRGQGMTDTLLAPPPPEQTPAPKGFVAWVKGHKIVSAVIAVLVLWAAIYNLTGHGLGASLKSHPASASSASSAPADPNGGPSAFIPNLVQRDPMALNDQPAEIWVDETKGVCDDFSGASSDGYPVGYSEVEGQYEAVQRDGMSANDAGFVIAGTSYFCPQFDGAVKAWLKNDTGYIGVATPTTTTTAPAPTSNSGNTGAMAPAPGSLVAGSPTITGAQVCADLISGVSATDEVNTISGAAAAGTYVPWGTAYEFLQSSVQSTCPQFTGALSTIQHG